MVEKHPGTDQYEEPVKTLYMLIGPKGSGKTHIGRLVGQRTRIHFLRVEAIWLDLKPGEDGWKKVESVIDDLFHEHDQVMIESLGAGDGFRTFYASLKEKYRIKMIRVYANLETCFSRVKSRDAAEHIPVSDEKLEEYNLVASGVSYEWALEIDNNIPAPDEKIIRAILSIEI